jgi:hypothetical protein
MTHMTFTRWDDQQRQRLKALWQLDKTVEEIAALMSRTPKAIENRLYKLALKPKWECRP